MTNVLVNEDDNANDKTKNDDVGVVELPAADKKPEETEKWSLKHFFKKLYNQINILNFEYYINLIK